MTSLAGESAYVSPFDANPHPTDVGAFSGEVDTGSPSENATTQREKSEARFYQNGIRSTAFSGEVGAGSP
jgi:hypothetical protein